MTTDDGSRTEDDPEVGGAGGTNPAAPERVRRRRRRLLIGAAIGGAVVIAALGTLVVLWSQVSTRSVTVDEARQRAAAEGEGSDTGESIPLRPAPGIYRYRGEGTERLDKPPTNQTQGPDIPGTLTHGDGGCWTLRVDYNTNHWQSWDYCPTGDGLAEHAGAFFQRLDLVVAQVDTSSSYTCDPPVDAIRSTQQAGDQWMQECSGTSSGTEGEVISTGPYTYVGRENLEIGGEDVESFHYRRLRNLSGGQTGTEDVHLWFDVDSGLPLRNERNITVQSDSLIGGVTYEETGSFQLVSTIPTE